MAQRDRLLLAVQEVLFREWDPIGINDDWACRSSTRSCIGGTPGVCSASCRSAKKEKGCFGS
jgi:hypothetical protein